ncbi:hypothetical protein [Methyloradius palustris]|uniref:Uncharacterized protein n=1 Tax=Methyloradius palustris TaxID=2778876 RepID=A0A8D5GA34_9PROT|nr:hypothetical protein [Methyloradius palustris]BCM24421.1 hypothetical protein ZMTM_06800 [Methyloradius palustris]
MAKYLSAPLAYEALADMIKNDAKEFKSLTPSYGCTVVGSDNIGSYWYSSAAGDWSSTQLQETKQTLSEVLNKVGMTSSRYREYVTLFEKTGSERVTYCPQEMANAGVHILVYRSGTMMGGWGAAINKRDDGNIPEDRNTNCCSTKNIKIRDNWYLSLDIES